MFRWIQSLCPYRMFLSQVCIQVNVGLGGELGLQRSLLGLVSNYWQKVSL